MDLEEAIRTPVHRLSEDDLASVLSGRDRFTPMSLPTLEAILKRRQLHDEQAAVAAAFPDSTARAKAFRWLLRGLDAQKTIRKVTADLLRASLAHGREYNPL